MKCYRIVQMGRGRDERDRRRDPFIELKDIDSRHFVNLSNLLIMTWHLKSTLSDFKSPWGKGMMTGIESGRVNSEGSI